VPPQADADEGGSYQRTLREAQTAARLSHPGVVTIYDVAEDDGRPWIVMELVHAPSLDQVIARSGPLRPRQAAHVGRQLLAALANAHAAGVLHRDVKPSNVLLAAGGRAVLTDFGIATFQGDVGLTQTGMVMGSPGFTAPERIRGEPATPASDLWSVGATLYAAVEGRGPFDRRGGPMTTMTAVINEDPPPALAAGSLAPVIHALLRREPAARPDAATAVRMLAAVVTDSTGEDSRLTAEGTTAGDHAPAASGWPAAGRRAAGGQAAAASLAAPTSADAARADAVGTARLPVIPAQQAGPPTTTDVPAAAPDARRLPAPDPPWRLPETTSGGTARGDTGHVLARGDNPPGSPRTGMAWEDDSPVRAGRAPRRRRPLVLAGITLVALATAGTLAAALQRSPGSGNHQAQGSQPGAGAASQAAGLGKLPRGYHWYTLYPASAGTTAGFSIAVPDGWQLTENGHTTLLRNGATSQYVEIDLTPHTFPNMLAEAHWLERRTQQQGTFPGYQRIAIRRTTTHGATAAAWQFAWQDPRIGQVEVRDVLFILNTSAGPQSYAVYMSAPAATWKTILPLFDEETRSFRPVPQ
jgi:hypothetical protein